MSYTTTVILGGGVGGIAAANKLRSLLPNEHKIIIVDKSPHFMVGATKTWVMLGQRQASEVIHNRSVLSKRGIQVLEHEVLNIDLPKGIIETNLTKLHADYLIIALGASLNMKLIPGLDQNANTFYTMEGARKLKPILNDFKQGELVLLIPRIPFKCPPAPYEAALMLHHFFSERGVRAGINISIFTIENLPMATAGQEIGQMVISELEKRGIEFNPRMQTLECNAPQKYVTFSDRREVPYDLLIVVPPHEAPLPVRQAGLVDSSGWIPVDSQTLEIINSSSRIPVFAVGDVTKINLPGRFEPTIPLVLPKAGVMAEAQGIVVAERISSLIRGKTPAAVFDGAGVCYLEAGNNEAIKGEGRFFNEPHPVMTYNQPDSKGFQEKLLWIEGWLKNNLGA
jgi:sulfide:quinone oxidoreductase